MASRSNNHSRCALALAGLVVWGRGAEPPPAGTRTAKDTGVAFPDSALDHRNDAGALHYYDDLRGGGSEDSASSDSASRDQSGDRGLTDGGQATDRAGRLFVLDRFNSRVRVIRQ